MFCVIGSLDIGSMESKADSISNEIAIVYRGVSVSVFRWVST